MEPNAEIPEPLRLASAEDHATVLRLIADYYAFDEIAFEEESISAGLASLLGSESLGRVFLIEAGGAVAGYVILTFAFDLEFGGSIAFVTDFYLKPEFRRQGLGSRAMESVFRVSRELGVKAIELYPERDNLEAQGFYLKVGFTAQDRLPMTKRL
jgi:ribosomal protein S18 acetylase RimI-like enzyme